MRYSHTITRRMPVSPVSELSGWMLLCRCDELQSPVRYGTMISTASGNSSRPPVT